MAYEYVKRMYGVNPVVGNAVTHTVTGKNGIIARESPGMAHYVRVRFDGQSHSLPCHPTELDYGDAKYPERKLCDGCDGHDCKDDCEYPMTDPFQHQMS